MYQVFKIPNTNYTLIFGGVLEKTAILDNVNIKNIILPITKGVKNYIKLDWFDGYKEYDLNLVICLSLNKANFPNNVLKNIDLVYKTLDTLDLNYNNFYYKFRNIIESEEKKNFYYIPYHSEYIISKDGVILKRNNLMEKKCHPFNLEFKNLKNIKGGYMMCQGFSDKFNSKSTTLARHRLLGMAFIDYKDDPFSLVINHKNGNPGEDYLDNLEWVTKQENNQHAYDNNLVTSKHRQIVAYNWLTNYCKIFSNIRQCCREIGVHESLVYSQNKSNRKRVDGWGFKIFPKDIILNIPVLKSTWYPEDAKIYYPPGLPIVGKNYITGEILEGDDVLKLSRKTNINPTSISERIKDRSMRLIKNFIFKYKHYPEEFPELQKETLELLKKKYS